MFLDNRDVVYRHLAYIIVSRIRVRFYIVICYPPNGYIVIVNDTSWVHVRSIDTDEQRKNQKNLFYANIRLKYRRSDTIAYLIPVFFFLPYFFKLFFRPSPLFPGTSLPLSHLVLISQRCTQYRRFFLFTPFLPTITIDTPTLWAWGYHWLIQSFRLFTIFFHNNLFFKTLSEMPLLVNQSVSLIFYIQTSLVAPHFEYCDINLYHLYIHSGGPRRMRIREYFYEVIRKPISL